MIPNVDKLDAVEAAIEPADKLSKRYGGPILKRRASALKALAGELRLRAEHSAGPVQKAIEDRLAAAYATLDRAHYRDAELIALGLAMIQHWGTIRQALEAFKQGEQDDEATDPRQRAG